MAWDGNGFQKHALRGFTVAMMKELYDTPIRVTEIQPGMVETCKSLFHARNALFCEGPRV